MESMSSQECRPICGSEHSDIRCSSTTSRINGAGLEARVCSTKRCMYSVFKLMIDLKISGCGLAFTDQVGYCKYVV
ncbi:hypothetical protein PILCRDRAFT_202147 [Piloderma croceum F 1598]|uniref:Uncharacterized protein n=1 Tax=Piloderma croceum (strain F 1598) TaxID=765440 RepID=A0A0C3BTQ9_PILCF|nr:hypothetical protein PILCRDRAFT_202147 [Piloderma croceum F 1598]